MKKVIFVTIIAFAMSLHTYAQFTIGPKVGLNLSTVHSTKVDDYADYKTGLNAGVFGKYSINSSFDIQTEVLYSQQGYKVDLVSFDYGGDPYLDPDLKVLTHNLNIPVLLRYNLLGKRWLYFEAGPQVGFLLKEKMKLENKEVVGGLKDMGMELKTVDLSIVGGIGFYLGNHFTINARYNYGLTSIHDLDFKNRVFQFSLAYDLWKF